MIKDFSTLRNSTAFKVAVAAFISFIFYLLGNFLLPILLAVGLAFLLHPVTKLFGKITLGRGTIHLSRVVTILMAFVAFGVIVFCAVTFIILPLFGQINALVGKIPDYTTKMDAATFDWLLEDPANYPRLPHNIESLFDYITSWLMGFVAAVLRNLLKSTLDIIANLVGLIVVPFLAFYFLKDWRDLRAMLINFFSYEAQPRVAHIIDEIGITLSCYIQGLARLKLLHSGAGTFKPYCRLLHSRWHNNFRHSLSACFRFACHPCGNGAGCGAAYRCRACGVYSLFAKPAVGLLCGAVLSGVLPV